MRVEIESYNPKWPRKFEREAEDLADLLGPLLVISHHIGSTAVPAATARPIIDLLLEVTSLEEFDPQIDSLADLGYTFVGEQGIPGRRFFIKKDAQGRRTHNLFVFPAGHPAIRRCLDFRDYLMTHTDDATFYGLLKRDLAARFSDDLASYVGGKEEFVRDVLRKAEVWRRTQPPGRPPEGQ